MHRKIKIGTVSVIAAVALALGGISVSNATGITEIEVPGAGWVVAEPGTPQEDIDAAVKNADELLSPEEAQQEAEEDAQTPEISLEPFGDSGTPEELEAARTAAVALIEQDLESQRSGLSADERREVVADAYAQDKTPAQVAFILRAVADAEQGTLPNALFTEHEVAVAEWLGTRVDGEKAVALLEGTQRLHAPDGWHEGRYRWRLDLVREDGEWQIDRLVFDDLTSTS